MQNQMLSCFFPTTVVFIDDNSNYLTGLLSSINMQHIVPKLFSNPIEAVQFINHQHGLLQSAIFTPLDDQPADHVGFDINIRDFHQKLLAPNKRRFNELTVVVCDYAMPQKNGLEVLQEIKNIELKTIMLTGEADELLAVAAFNRGLIDHFLCKGSSNFTQTLNNTILGLQQDYIARATGLMVSNIILGKLPHSSALADPVFIQLFESIKQKHHIVEYYLLDEQGSFLLLTLTGQAYFLAVLNTAAL
ncbi:MAG TPA: response regulator, partial [Gammaproteobacteria bacterium]|nr:response regulator [Gammaproteobacteria bacterium]